MSGKWETKIRKKIMLQLTFDLSIRHDYWKCVAPMCGQQNKWFRHNLNICLSTPLYLIVPEIWQACVLHVNIVTGSSPWFSLVLGHYIEKSGVPNPTASYGFHVNNGWYPSNTSLVTTCPFRMDAKSWSVTPWIRMSLHRGSGFRTGAPSARTLVWRHYSTGALPVWPLG